MTGTINLKVDADDVERLVRQCMLDDAVEAESKKVRKAAHTMLKYYSTPTQWIYCKGYLDKMRYDHEK